MFVDIDDTLVTTDKKLTDRTQLALINAQEMGIKIVLTSGRSREVAIGYQEKYLTSPYIISSNGADAYAIDEKQEIYYEPIDKKIVRKIYSYVLENDLRINLNYDFELAINKMYYPHELKNVRTNIEIENIIDTKRIAQVVVIDKDMDKMLEFKKFFAENIEHAKIENESKRFNNPEFAPKRNYYCDITSSKVSKGKAVMSICNFLGFDPVLDAIAIGDGKNDISMFEVVGEAVAVENANDDVKKVATKVIDTNDNDGVAKYIESIIEK